MDMGGLLIIQLPNNMPGPLSNTIAMRFHEFQIFSDNPYATSIGTIDSMAFGAFTASGRFRCVMKEPQATLVNLHESVTIDRPGIHPFFVVHFSLLGYMTSKLFIATNLEQWCRASFIQGADYVDRTYPDYISIRPKDVREVNYPKTLSRIDRNKIERYIGKSKIMQDL